MAQLMLHRDVLTEFGSLPAKVQKKVSELIRKFQEDSKQASIHLEKVERVVDDKVRSARLGDDWRAIVIAPQQGETFLLMHVDHHDEAYRWCRNKRFEAHGALGVLQVFDTEEVREAAERIRPAAPAPELATTYALDALSDDELFQAGVPRPLVPAVRAIRDDAAFDEIAAYLPQEAAQVLFSVIAGYSLNEAIEQTLGAAANEAVRPIGPGDFSKLANASNADLVLVEDEQELRKFLAEDIEAWRVFLHPYQRKLVETNVRGALKVSGAAGTGKTVVLMHRAVHLARNSKDDKSRVLITTFSANLAVTIEDLIHKLDASAAKRIEVTNLHRLARTICMRAGWQGRVADEQDIDGLWTAVFAERASDKMEPGEFSARFVREEYDEVVDAMGIDNEEEYLSTARTGRARLSRQQRRKLWAYFQSFNRLLQKRGLMTFEGIVHQARLIAEKPEFPRYRYVLVDEVQDFGLEGLRLIASLTQLHDDVDNPLSVFGDAHQRIVRQTTIPLARAGIDVRGRSRRLKINYRMSEQIRRWAHALLSGMRIDDLDSGPADTTGDRSVFRGPEPLIREAATTEEAARIVSDWVLDLSQKAQVKPHEICIAPALPEVRTALSGLGIQSLELLANKADPGPVEPGVRLASMRRIKGLEFKAVAMIVGPPPDDRGRFEQYVVATRAQRWLLAVHLNEQNRTA